MYNASQDYLDFINDNSIVGRNSKNKVVIDNVEYSSDTLKTNPKISHKATSFIGGFPVKTCNFEILNIDGSLSLNGKEVTVYKGLEINGSVEWVKMGIFSAKDEDITTDQTTKSISFSGTDRTILFDNSYTSSLDWATSHTGLEIIQEVCEKVGVTLESTAFNFSAHVFTEKPNFKENITYREVVSRIAEIGGEISYISREGGLKIVGQYTTNQAAGKSKREKITKENEFKVNTVVLGKEDIDDDIVYPKTYEGTRVEWKIKDNPYVDLIRESIIEDVANNIIGMSIIPYFLTGFIDDYIYDLNDVISVTDNNGDTFNAVILEYETQSRIKSNISASTQTESITNYKVAGSVKESIAKVQFQVNHNTLEVTSLASQVDSQNQKISQVTQTVNELNSKISDVADITISKESINGTVSFEKINQSEPIYIKVKPINESISYLYPNENLYPSDTLYLKERTIRFKNKTTNEVFEYELPDDLLYFDGNNYDEFILDYDAQSCVVNKKVGYTQNRTTYLLEQSRTEEYEYPRIELTDGDYEIELAGYDNAYIFVRLMSQNIYTTQFATKAEMKSEIRQTADSITNTVSSTYTTKSENTSTLNTSKSYTDTQVASAKTEIKQTTDNISSIVAKKVGNDEVISKINQSSESVGINANKIELSANDVLNLLAGNTINLSGKNIKISSNNFNVDENGNMSCNGGDFNGKIETASGSIGGWNITSDGLTNGTWFINKNGYTNMYTYVDIIVLQNYLTGKIEITDPLERYDLNKDGEVNSGDLFVLRQMILGQD